MNNITVSRVMTAYKSGVVKPGFEGWGSIEKNCGCAMSALALYEQSETFPTLKQVLNVCEYFGSDRVCKALDVSKPYMFGFTDAYDGMRFGLSHHEGSIDYWEDFEKAEYHMGFDHGTAVRIAVFNEYFPDGYVVTEGSL
ncbi:hypothetical protein ABER99_20135 [Paenibacillus glucanolyticus]|jgi:hypothetical protein|uniref:Uncharacterized protein n=1 Tax=Paenibacillus glucanolyticus TaxID=59843 RepID=A0A163GM60_9BACL|nr:hypothetical protein [Paenibacillus glucanolyticus]KZS45040.1 hypothetical protein AWU65_03400 [Paenibacillus glucanolyticus]OMF66722.1 hypothetical protein BK142_29315 [Paenibacillus glucanolyticus]